MESFSATANLTPKESQVLFLVVKGMSRKEIACTLGIAYSTVDTHFKHIFLKLNTRTMTETAVYAIYNNLLSR